MALMLGALDREPKAGFCGKNFLTHLCVFFRIGEEYLVT
jgi:hypothetical protein